MTRLSECYTDSVQGGNMKCLQIIEIATNKVEKEFDITGESESYIDKLEMGLARQLNWDLYRIAFVEKDRGTARTTALCVGN